MKSIPGLLAAVGLVGLAGCATGPTAEDINAYDYGPPPTKEQIIAAAEPAVRNLLRDPESAQFRWGGYPVLRSYYRKILQGAVFGYVTCGEVNARNGFGGYTGYDPFVVVWDKGRIVSIDMEGAADTMDGFVTSQCNRIASQ